jgi:DNA polymerase (family 10)
VDIQKKFSNAEIARMFFEVVAVYQVLGESFFKVRAYQNAISQINNLTTPLRDLWSENKLNSIPGIGSAVISYLDEYFRTGKIEHFDSVRDKVPKGMFTLLEIPGIGPKTAFTLASSLKISSREDLIHACEKGLVANLGGFGEKSQNHLLTSARTPAIKKDRVLLCTALQIAENIQDYLNSCTYVLSSDLLGSLRRRVATVGDIDIAVSTNNPLKVVDFFCGYKNILQIDNKGDKKASVILKSGQRVDLMTGDPRNYGTLLAHLTGSKLHNVELRTFAQHRGYSISEYGIKSTQGREFIFKNEEDMYRHLGLQYIPAELREGGNEIKLALKKQLPRLLDIDEILGDMQMHTIYSDGENTIKEMASKAVRLGYKYIGITDHSLSQNTHSKKDILSYIKSIKLEIEKLNYSENTLKIFLGTECNILSDGNLSLEDEILKEYDFAIASIHTSFNQTKDQITKRLLNAVSNPYINFIGHPTGRILLEREAYPVDWNLFFSYCIKYNKPVEINAFPTRLDLPDDLVKQAKESGVKLLINTDSHSTAHMDYMKYGVFVAKRGWCSTSNILNTGDLSKIINSLNIRNQQR